MRYKHEHKTLFYWAIMLSVTFSKNNPTSPDISSSGWLQYILLYMQPASWSEMCFVEAHQPELLVGAMIWLGLRWLQSCWLQCTALSERARGMEREWLRVGLSVCQAVKSNAVLYFCVQPRCAWVAERRFKMNQLISKSSSEDINTKLVAVISTQECDTMLCVNWPLWIGSRQRKRRSTSERLPFHKQRYHRQTLSTASALSWHCARVL